MTFEGEAWEQLPGASRLTPFQREAIEAEDPLLCVLAGAGAIGEYTRCAWTSIVPASES